MSEAELYLEGEERFGYLSSRFYNSFTGMVSKSFYRSIVEIVVGYHPKTILDVGSGPADVLLQLAQFLPDSRLFGVDPSTHMLEIARKRISKNDLAGRIKVVSGSSREVPLDYEFDMIISSFSFHHWKEQTRGLEHLLSKLGKTGRLLIFDLNPSIYPGRFTFVRKHTLSHETSSTFSFSGFDREIGTTPDGKLTVLSFSRS